ncbi:MAG TPA: TIGR03067 domain-containing protein [Planctomycetes bacterium]|nr:TIGR03067 domain-containing protein [Planctomycetota bacterium]
MLCLVAALSIGPLSFGADEDPELKKFQGHWEVTDLIENGKVIAKEKIRELLPSGGRAEIIGNAIIFRSPQDGKQHSKVFRIEPTKYPKRIEITASQGKDSWGIYQFDTGKLVICLADPDEADRPDDFSAEADSNRMMMVLKRTTAKRPAAKAPAVTAATKPKPTAALQGLTDAQITKMLAGTWRLNDNAGFLFITFRSNGTVSTVREYQELRLFHKSFVQTPISGGTWSVKNGQLTAHVTRSVEIARVNRLFSFSIRSVSATDLIFVDSLGRVARAARVQKP